MGIWSLFMIFVQRRSHKCSAALCITIFQDAFNDHCQGTISSISDKCSRLPLPIRNDMMMIIINLFEPYQSYKQKTQKQLIQYSMYQIFEKMVIGIILGAYSNKITSIILFIMSAPLTEYYSVSSRGYTKHPNIEVLGIETLLPRATHSILSLQRDFQHESVIQQEENQYDPLQPKQQRPKLPTSLTARIMEREEVASIHLTPKCNTQSLTPKCNTQSLTPKCNTQSLTPKCNTQSLTPKCNTQCLTSSCINQSHAVPQRGILKRSLMELQKKNITSQQDTNNDKQLYIELQKERRLRRELEKHYKQLLSEMHRKERSYSVDLDEKERKKERTRQFSKRTLNQDKSSEGLISAADMEAHKDHKVNKTVKTVKLGIPTNKTQQQHESPQDNEQQNGQEGRSLQSSRKSTRTQQSAEQQAEYFREQKEFQDGVISQLRHLNKRIEHIDHFLLEKQREQEMERLERIIQQKQRQIYNIQQENERLRGMQKEQTHFQAQKQSEGVQRTILKNVTPTNLYLLLIILMAIVAMS